MPYIAAAFIANGVKDVLRDSKGIPIIKENESYFRAKLQDDPILVPTGSGLIHFVMDLKNFPVIAVDGKKQAREFDKITLAPISITAKGKDKSKIVLPTPQVKVVAFWKNRRFAVLLNNLGLPAGDYESLEIEFADDSDKFSPHSITIEGNDYPLRFHGEKIKFQSSFKVESGKITTLHARPKQKEIAKYDGGKYHSEIEARPSGVIVYSPIDKVWLTTHSITIADSSGKDFFLNDTTNKFDLLALRSGFVALIGNKIVPAGTYASISLNLDPDSAVEISGKGQKLNIINEINTTIAIKGPFELRGGRVTEFILDFNPNLSIIKTLDEGFVLEPDIQVVSNVSMTGAQDIRTVSSLKNYANLVFQESELIFQGTVLSKNTTLANDIYGRQKIYSDQSIVIEDRLRGHSDAEPLILRTVGGEMNGLKLKVHEMPEFTAGEKCILFLKKSSGRYVPVRGSLGKVSL